MSALRPLDSWAWKLRRAWRWAKRLRVTTKMGTLQMEAAYERRRAEKAMADLRDVERYLVLLTEPMKDWDLADFPEPARLRLMANGDGVAQLSAEDAIHLANVLDAYRLTATKVAPIRAHRVLDDRSRGRGWDDQPLTTTHPNWRP